MRMDTTAGAALAGRMVQPPKEEPKWRARPITGPPMVNGRKIFYREAGDPAAGTVLLLHGLPTSSQMFRDLIPLLADRFHLIAPDYIGFGHSDAPSTRNSTTPSITSPRMSPA